MNETDSKSTDPFENVVVPPKKARAKTPRFTNREQIIARIDKFTAKAKRQREAQRDNYLKAAQLRRHTEEFKDDDIIAKLRKFNDMGDAWGRKADRLERDVLNSLRQKMAEFDTQTIPGITDDRSVPGV